MSKALILSSCWSGIIDDAIGYGLEMAEEDITDPIATALKGNSTYITPALADLIRHWCRDVEGFNGDDIIATVDVNAV